MRKNTTALKSVGQRLVREASQPAPAARRYDVIVFGATGFTGLLTAQYYARRQKSRPETFTWAIAGRSLQKMNNLEGIPSSVPRIVANSNDQASLEAMTRQTKVVATTVGPYIKYGAKLVAACIATGTHYCDLTGEFVWVRDMIKKHHQAAQAARCKIVFCCGFDCVPVDLGTYMASTLLPSGPPTRVRALATRVNGAASGGTLASAELIKERLKADAAAGIPDDPYMLAHDIVGEPANGALPHHDLRVDTADLSAGQTSVRWDSDWGTITIPYVMAFIDCRVIRRSICLRGEKTSYVRPCFVPQRYMAHSHTNSPCPSLPRPSLAIGAFFVDTGTARPCRLEAQLVWPDSCSRTSLRSQVCQTTR